MKYTLILILLLITASSGMAQKSSLGINPHPVNFVPAASITDRSDTLVINLPLQVHFIKIGDDIYQIVEHKPTVEKVEPSKFSNPGGRLFGDHFYGPVYSSPTDDNLLFPFDSSRPN